MIVGIRLYLNNVLVISIYPCRGRGLGCGVEGCGSGLGFRCSVLVQGLGFSLGFRV